VAESEELHARRHPLRRPHWLLLRWLGLRRQRRLGWLGVLLLGVGPLVAAGLLLYYVRCGGLQANIERDLSQALGGPVRVSGLRMVGWQEYGLARLTLSSPRPGAEPILKAEACVLQTGEGLVLTFSRATVDLSDGDALAHWSRLLRAPAGSASIQVVADAVRLEGAPEELSQADTSIRGGLVLTPSRRLASLRTRLPGDEHADLVVQSTPGEASLSFKPRPLLLGADRLSALLGWPAALLPPDLTGEVVVTTDGLGVRTRLNAQGSLDLAGLTRQLSLPACSGSVTLNVDLECARGSAWGTVAVSLADGPARVDPLALETFRYVFLGRLSEVPIDEEPWTVDRIAFVVKFEGDRVTVEGAEEGRPLLRGRSEGGSALELRSPALSTLEELARRGRLALGR